MARGRKTALTIHLTPGERWTLLVWQRATTIAAGRARRGRILLLVAEGMPLTDLAATVGISRRFIYKRVYRCLEHGMHGWTDRDLARSAYCASLPWRSRRLRVRDTPAQTGWSTGEGDKFRGALLDFLAQQCV